VTLITVGITIQKTSNLAWETDAMKSFQFLLAVMLAGGFLAGTAFSRRADATEGFTPSPEQLAHPAASAAPHTRSRDNGTHQNRAKEQYKVLRKKAAASPRSTDSESDVDSGFDINVVRI